MARPGLDTHEKVQGLEERQGTICDMPLCRIAFVHILYTSVYSFDMF